jgi:phage portal protein BeeE
VPPFKIGLGQMPTYQNGQTLNTIYYTDCLQSHVEQFELCMDDGLGIGEGVSIGGRTFGVDLDEMGLLRMDSETQIRMLGEGVKGSILKIDEARAALNRKKVPGGDTIWSQQQNYSLEALMKRDASADPFGTATPPPAPPVEPAKAFDRQKAMDAFDTELAA